MNKIFLSIITILAVVAVTATATLALFSDTETSTGNTFAAGTLNLNLDGANTNVVKFNLPNIKPGDSGCAYWTVKNVGTVDGYLDLENKTVVNYENTCIDSETEIGDSSCGPGTDQGELGGELSYVIFDDFDYDCMQDGGETQYAFGDFNNLPGKVIADIALPAGAEKYLALSWSLSFNAGNYIQTDSVVLGMTFKLRQTTGQ